jgi:NAD(P)-dependent dehydrogenase (short-subunit alcohol dehydrogenase family)
MGTGLPAGDNALVTGTASGIGRGIAPAYKQRTTSKGSQ